MFGVEEEKGKMGRQFFRSIHSMLSHSFLASVSSSDSALDSFSFCSALTFSTYIYIYGRQSQKKQRDVGVVPVQL